ncbi:MAG TPA: hypothetical protein VF074_23910 [Pyrinomonadaceae bacterium]
MKRSIIYISISALTFTVGTYISTRRNRQIQHSSSQAITKKAIEEEQWPLSKMLVSRALQQHSFRSDKVRRNSNDEVVWRWLKQSIAEYPQNWVRLKISEGESYGVVLYPMTVLEPQQIVYYNRELKAKGLPTLDPSKRYLPINVSHGDIICPNWAGLIDVEEAKLVFFEGSSG